MNIESWGVRCQCALPAQPMASTMHMACIRLRGAHAGQYGVSGFPTIMFMYHDGTKIKSVDYNSGRTAKDIINFAMDKAKSLAFKRIGQKSGGSSGSSGGGAGG